MRIWLLLLLLAPAAYAQKYYNQTTLPPNLPILYQQNYSTLQALSDAVPVTGGTIVLSRSVSAISAVITLKSNTTVQCHPGVTLTMTDASVVTPNHWIFANQHYTATTLTDSNIRILGCGFNGNAVTPSTGADAIRMVFVSDVEVSNNTFTSFGDGTAFLGTTRTLEANNNAYNITNTCFDHWYGASYITITNGYCETKKHGIQVTGTDTAQTSAGITSHVTIINPTIVLFSNSAIGAGIYLNSGALTDTGAGVQDATIIGGHILTSGLGASIGSCVKISGSGSSNDWVIGVHCDNSIISVSPNDTATSYPADIHILGAEVNITNSLAEGAIQIKSGTSGVDSSRVIGGGYAYCINMVGATNQYAKNNSCIDGTDGSTPRVHADGTAIASAIIIDPNETGTNAAINEPAAIYNAVSYRSPVFILGTAANGYIQYAGSHEITLDAKDSGTGFICLRTDPGTGLTNRLCILNGGEVVTTPTTVSALPAAAAGNKGARSFVTDATATTFGSVVSGSGANNVPVYSDGTNWRIG